jgi:hypothetical protein
MTQLFGAAAGRRREPRARSRLAMTNSLYPFTRAQETIHVFGQIGDRAADAAVGVTTCASLFPIAVYKTLGIIQFLSLGTVDVPDGSRSVLRSP